MASPNQSSGPETVSVGTWRPLGLLAQCSPHTAQKQLGWRNSVLPQMGPRSHRVCVPIFLEPCSPMWQVTASWPNRPTVFPGLQEQSTIARRLKQQMPISHHPGGWESSACRWTSPPCICPRSSLCACLCPISSPWEDTCPAGSGPIPMTSFSLNHLFKG